MGEWGTEFFRPTYAKVGAELDRSSSIAFEPEPDPMPVGVHEAVFLHEGREFPATVTVREDGSVSIRAELHPVA